MMPAQEHPPATPAASYTCLRKPESVDPFDDSSVFDAAMPVQLTKPRLWPGSEAGGCEARVMYCDQYLWLSYAIQGGSFAAPAAEPPKDTDWCHAAGMPERMWPILDDDRVEIFMWHVGAENPDNEEDGEHYHIIECNREGLAIKAKVGFRKEFDFSWQASGMCAKWIEAENRMVLAMPWACYGIDISTSPRLRVALCRGERNPDGQGVSVSGIWSSWVDSHDDTVDFHRSNHFGELVLSQQ